VGSAVRRANRLLPALAVAAVLLFSGSAPVPSAAADPLTFHCALDASCPEVTVAGDPHATIGGGPAPFRGYGDPSLEYDPDTSTLWMSYSWLDVLVTNPGPSQQIDFGVRTHLARSDDEGASFAFVESLNESTPISHPDTSASGWASHEVSTMAREGPGEWQTMWLTYFDPTGTPPFSDPYYQRALGTAPDSPGSPMNWARGKGTSPSWGSLHNLSAEIPQLADCTAFTEPALFAYGGQTYLATNCVVFLDGVRQDAQERLVLLRQEANGYTFVGNLLDGADAVDTGGTRIEQADIALSKMGEILLIATPIQEAQPNHLGCLAFEITDITAAEVLRDGAGKAVQLASITGEDSTIGPGLCTYDANSETGVLMVLHILNTNPFDLEFSLRATGVHPMDTDGDGIENTLDGEDDGDGFSDATEAQIGTAALDGCGPGIGPDPSTAWPLDFVSGGIPDSTDRINITDLVSMLAPIRYLGASPPGPPYDPRRDLVPGGIGPWINIQDITAFIAGPSGSPPMFGGARAFNGPACP
jgi:hypothetical protein